MLGSRRRPVALSALAGSLLFAACAVPPSEPRVLGEVPTAVTTAVAEWLPKRVRSGTAEPDDAREARLSETRRLTTGFDVDELAFLHELDALVLVGRRPGSTETTVVFVDLATGKTNTGADASRARGVSVTPDGANALFVTQGPSGRALEEMSIARVVARVFGVPAKDAGFAIGELVPSRVAISADGEQAYMVGGPPKQPTAALYALARGASAPTAAIASGVADVTPAVSPDRAYVSFVRSSGSTEALVIASIEGRSPRTLDEQAHFASVAFHPSDGTVVYGSDRDAAAFELYRAPTSGERSVSPERLTYRGAKAVAFSSDGRVVAYTSRRAGPTHDVYVSRYRSDR